jgi:UDP-N-acetylmuramoyl-L-alanyl-D-glutamate--2,6-diaminopimelate ligase
MQLLTPYKTRHLHTITDVGTADISITGLVTDNRDVKAGDCFIALAGITHHGKEFIGDAITRGACAVLIDAGDDFNSVNNNEIDQKIMTTIPIVSVSRLTDNVNNIVLDFYRQESAVDDLPLMAVTGTNGKSSITRFAAQMCHQLNHPTGLMGTLGFGVWPNVVESKNTTPELAVLLRQFSLMKEQGAQQVMMEVSSHGIAQKRIEGLVFETAVFSNLTQDHLDYHGDMETYYDIKRALFLLPTLKHAIINIDDEYGQRLMDDAAICAQKISYGFSSTANVRVLNWSSNGSSIDASISTPWGEAEFNINMVGDFNLSNVLAAISILVLEKVGTFTEVISALPAVTSAPGRMQTYSKDDCANVVIDFAHTPAALSNVLTTLVGNIKTMKSESRLSIVFGCGGNRDADKRPQMAAIAQAIADRVILTADNPRTENFENIIDDMQAGLKLDSDSNELVQVTVEQDRTTAIQMALSELSGDDILLIAGKGHENYQDINGVKIPYSDEQVLFSLGYRSASNDINNTYNESLRSGQ